MSNPERRERSDPYDFSEYERSFDRIATERLLNIIKQPDTQIHSLELATNNYGEFLFISTSRPSNEGRTGVTFWGAGYHEYRERWLTREWFWYRNNPRPGELIDQIDREAARESILARLADISVYGDADRQSSRGKMFELIADLTDDDGAIVDIEDMAEWLADDDE